MTHVALYTRLSLDPGAQTATARQEEACRAFAAARDWTVSRVFEDVDRSAYQKSIRRPAFEALREAIAVGTYDGAVVWKLDRLARRPADFERFWEACEQSGSFITSVTEPVDSSTEIGLAIVRVLVTFAGLESTTIGLRLQSRFRELAQQGRGWSGQRPFGYTKDWKALVPEEAAAIQDAAQRVLAGETLSLIAREWAAAGITTTRGNTWGPHRIMAMLCAPRLVGDRAWHGEEIVARDCFPAVLDRATHQRLRRLAANRERGARLAPERTLLAGLLLCGECGHVMYSSRRTNQRIYSCPPPPAGCGGAHVTGLLIDEWVTAAVLDRIRTQPVLPQHRRLDSARYIDLVSRLEVLHHDFHVEQGMSRAAYLSCRTDLDGQLGDLATQSNLPAIEGLPTGFQVRYAASAWPVLKVGQRRSIIASQLAHVTVARAKKRTGRFDPARLVVRWRQPDRAPQP